MNALTDNLFDIQIRLVKMLSYRTNLPTISNMAIHGQKYFHRITRRASHESARALSGG